MNEQDDGDMLFDCLHKEEPNNEKNDEVSLE